MRERFVLRDEVFGGTIFDRKTLAYQYVAAPELNKITSFEGIPIEHPEHWKATTETTPKDLLYAPIRVYFETTRLCNLRCKPCFNASGVKDSDEMSTREVFKSLEGMREDHIFDVRFTGGEFLTRPDWYEILTKAIDLGLGASMNTNGVFNDPSVVDKIASLDLAQVHVSIDGARDHHDYLRGRGNFDKTMSNMKLLHERGVHLRTNTLITKRTMTDMEDVVQTVAPLVEEMNFFHMRFTGRARALAQEALSYQGLYEFNERAKQIVKHYPNVNILFAEQGTRNNSIRMNTLGLKTGGPDGFTKFCLLANGSLWAGGFTPYIDRNLQYGNIKDEGYTMLNVWRNSQKLNNFRDFSHQLLMRCLDCNELDIHCPGINVEMQLIGLKFPDLGNPYCISDKPSPQYPIMDPK